jgi:hypothetical protein
MRAAAVLAVVALAGALAAAAVAAPRTATGNLDRDPSLERATVRAVSTAGLSQRRVVVSDPDTPREGRLGPAVDRVGRLLVADFAGLGSEQVFMDGSSGASGRFYAAALGRWTGSALRVLWRYDTGHAAGTVGSALARPNGRTIRLREVLVPAGDPGCCPATTRLRLSVYRYSPTAGRYVLVSRRLGPVRPT